MKSAAVVRGRTPVKKEHITGHLRDMIVSGNLRPGTRLPTRTDLEQTFQTSPATVQSALDALVRDGFVRVQGRQGTFVAEDLPFLTRFGFVLPRRPTDGAAWPRFFTSLATEVARVNTIGDVNLPVYIDVNDANSDGRRQLEHDVRSNRLAGLVFVAEAMSVLRSGILSECSLPMLCIAHLQSFGKPVIYLSVESVIDRALDYLQAAGKMRVAVAYLGDWERSWGDYLQVGLARRHMTMKPHWMQGFHYKYPEAASNCMDLLMRSQAADPFDALLIADDNLTPSVVQGIESALKGGASLGDVEIVAHANFPTSESYGVPIKRIGFDNRMVVAECVSAIRAEAAGEQVAERTMVPAVFDHELARD